MGAELGPVNVKFAVVIVKGSIASLKATFSFLLTCTPVWALTGTVELTMAQYLKGKSSYRLKREFSALRKHYWGQHLWGRGYFCSTVGAVTEP